MINNLGNNSSSIKSATNIKNSLSYNTRKKIENECSAGSTTSNTVTITDSNLKNVSAKMANEVKSSCEMRAALNDLLQSNSNMDTASAIAENQMNSGLFSANESNTDLYTMVSNRVSSKSTLSVVNRCMQKIDLKNILTITDSTVAGSEFDMRNTSFNDCLQESLLDLANKNGFIGEAEKVVEKHQTKTSPSLLGGSMIMWIVGAIIAVVVLYFIMRTLCRTKLHFFPPCMMLCRFLPFAGPPVQPGVTYPASKPASK